MMKKWWVAGALMAGMIASGLPMTVEAASPGKPLFSGTRSENDSEVQHVRDALVAFSGVNKHWPATLAELTTFAQQYRLPLDLAVFEKANYTVQNQAGASVAVFEFVMKGSPTKGAFAIANYSVK